MARLRTRPQRGSTVRVSRSWYLPAYSRLHGLICAVLTRGRLPAHAQTEMARPDRDAPS